METRSVARGTCYAVQLQAEMSEVHATRRIPRVDAALAMAYVHFHLKNRSCVTHNTFFSIFVLYFCGTLYVFVDSPSLIYYIRDARAVPARPRVAVPLYYDVFQMMRQISRQMPSVCTHYLP